MANTQEKTRKVRWGIIGATARIAKDALIPAILSSEHAELVAVASRSRDSAREIAAQAGPEVAAYGDYDSLIADGNVDVVYLPLPNNLHLGWAVEATATSSACSLLKMAGIKASLAMRAVAPMIPHRTFRVSPCISDISAP